MSGQAVDFFRPWNNADKKADGSSPGVDEYEGGVAGKGPKLNPEEDFDSESDDSSLAGSSSSYNSIDSEQSIDGPLRHRRHRRSTKPMVVGAAPVVCQEVGLPRVYPAFAQPGIWDPLGLRLEEAVYFNGIAAEVDRIHQQEFAAKQIKKTRPKNFNCNYCPAAFSNNGQLKGHLRTHTGEKPFRCNAEGCSRAFTRNEELTRHKRIHTGLKPFVCDLCQKKFGRKDHLKKHFKTHNRYSNAAEYDFAYMATLLSGHYYGAYYPPPPPPATTIAPNGGYNLL